MKLANMVDLGSAGSNTLQVQVLPIVIFNFIRKGHAQFIGQKSVASYGWKSTGFR